MFERFMDLKGQALRKWLMDILKDKYPKHDPIVERISHYLVTMQDIKDFSHLATDLYEIGYIQCMNDYKAKLNNMGINVTLTDQRN